MIGPNEPVRRMRLSRVVDLGIPRGHEGEPVGWENDVAALKSTHTDPSDGKRIDAAC